MAHLGSVVVWVGCPTVLHVNHPTVPNHPPPFTGIHPSPTYQSPVPAGHIMHGARYGLPHGGVALVKSNTSVGLRPLAAGNSCCLSRVEFTIEYKQQGLHLSMSTCTHTCLTLYYSGYGTVDSKKVLVVSSYVCKACGHGVDIEPSQFHQVEKRP